MLHKHKGEFTMVVPARLTVEAANQLREGVNLLLTRWTALQMAVQNEWGGRDTREKAQQFSADIFNWLTQPAEALYVDELEDLLDEFMLSLNTEIDDGSIEEIAENLMIMHEECLEGNFVSVERLRQPIPQNAAVSHQVQAVDGGEDDSDSTSASGDEMTDEPNSNLNADGDDWTIVSSRRNRGSRR